MKPDDNESVADSLFFLLDCYGHHAAVAYDGGTALRLLRTGAFEITFLDENLPDIKGEWCRMVAEGNADSLRGFPRFNEGRCQSGRHCAGSSMSICRSAKHSCRSSKTFAGAAMRILAKPPSQLLSTEAHTTQLWRFNGKPFRVTEQSEQQLSA